MSRFPGYAAVVVAVALLGAGAAYVLRPTKQRSPPPPVVAAAEHHHDEEVVTLSDAKVAAAGIELATAGPRSLHDSLRLNGLIQPNQEQLVQVTPRFPGVIRELRKRIGDRVNKGDLLATIESNQSLTAYQLNAPISGTIIGRQAALGEYASEQKPAFVIADLSTVWIDFPVHRNDFGRVRVGQPVVIDIGDGGPPVETNVAYVSPIAAADTQSILARAFGDNRDARLRPGLFVTATARLAARPAAIAVKSEALQTYEGRTVVFVRSGETFEPRQVEPGERDPDHVQIRSGLRAGEIYAARNSFVIKAELAKGTASHDH